MTLKGLAITLVILVLLFALHTSLQTGVDYLTVLQHIVTVKPL